MTNLLRKFEVQLGLLILAVAVCVTLASWPATLIWRMGDPDDQMRLVQVRDFLAGQSWFDVTQYRMNPPDGGPMHWSRLVDIPLILVIGSLSLVMNSGQAEWLGSIIVPLVTLAILLALIADVARRIWGHGAGLVAASLPLFCHSIISELTPLRIDHHGWQLVLFAFCLRQILTQKPESRSAAAKLGLAIALWLLISIEALPFALLFSGLLALRWLKRPELSSSLLSGLWGMTIALATGFVATRGFGDLVAHCDAVSPFHVAALGTSTVVMTLLAPYVDRVDGRARLVVAGASLVAATLTALAVVSLAAPKCMSGMFVELDPLVRSEWFDRVLEGLPVWKQPVMLLPMLPLLLLTAISAGIFVRRQPNGFVERRLEPALILTGGLIVGSLVMRAMVYPMLLGCILAAGLFIMIWERVRSINSPLKRVLLFMPAPMLLFPGLPDAANSALGSPIARITLPPSPMVRKMVACQRASTSAQLNKLPPAQLMALLDASPSILQHTHHKVVATGHHRNQLAMRDVILAFVGPISGSEKIFAKRGIEFLALCPFAPELNKYARNAPNGLWGQIKAGNPPKWLTREADIGLYQIWRFTPDRN